MKVYIAGPMRGKPGLNFPAFDAARDKLIAEGYEVVSPADLDRRAGIEPGSLLGLTPEAFRAKLEEIVRRDFEVILDVDAIYLLDGWEQSTGARAELALAHWLQLKVLNAPPIALVARDDPAREPMAPGTIKVGEKLREASGAMRHSREGKGRYDLLSPWVLYPFCSGQCGTVRTGGPVNPPTVLRAVLASLTNLQSFEPKQRDAVMWEAFRNMHDYIHSEKTNDYTVRRKLSPHALQRLAVHMENGIKAGYSAHNWEKGISLGRFLDSAIRHTLQELNGDTDEDHAAAALWNMHGFLHTYYAIDRGALPESLNDLRAAETKEEHDESKVEIEVE